MLTIVNWIDLFTRLQLKYVIINALDYFTKNKGLAIHAWVIMPSHLHLIVSSNSNLSNIIRDFKKFTSKQLIKEIIHIPESRRKWLLESFKKNAKVLRRNTNYKVWKDGFHPVELNYNSIIDQKLDYIHFNPVVDEIVDEPEMYKFSSARDYSGKKGLIEVELLN